MIPTVSYLFPGHLAIQVIKDIKKNIKLWKTGSHKSDSPWRQRGY